MRELIRSRMVYSRKMSKVWGEAGFPKTKGRRVGCKAIVRYEREGQDDNLGPLALRALYAAKLAWIKDEAIGDASRAHGWSYRHARHLYQLPRADFSQP